MRREHFAQRTRGAPRELRNRVTTAIEIARPDGTAKRRQELGTVAKMIVGSRIADEACDECRIVDGSSFHAPSAELAVERRERGSGVRLAARDVVRGAVVPALKQHGGRGRGAVVARDVGDAAVAAVVDELPRFHGALRLGNLIVRVEAVAQHGPGETARRKRLLGSVVARRDHGGIWRSGLRARGIDHVAHAGRLGRGDRGLMLRGSPRQVRGAHDAAAAPRPRTRPAATQGRRSPRAAPLRRAPPSSASALGVRVASITSRGAHCANTSSAVRRPSCPDAPVIASRALTRVLYPSVARSCFRPRSTSCDALMAIASTSSRNAGLANCGT